MKWRVSIIPGSAAAVLLLAVLAACQAPRMPAVDGSTIEVRRSDTALLRGDFGFADSLQIWWFGSGCQVIQLGDARIVVDPFVTNDFSPLRMASSPARVDATLGRIPVPDAVLITHSHHDHILDAHAAMSLAAWRARAVPLWGGSSAGNLLAGYNDSAVLSRVHAVNPRGDRFPVDVAAPGYSVKVTAFRSRHAPHMKCGVTFFDGLIKEPRTSPPSSISDFQAGEVFNYLIQLSSPGRSFSVFCLAAPGDLNKLPESVPPPNTKIDVVLMLAPSADNVRGYPEEHLRRLKPAHIVLNHFNTFAREDPDATATLFGKRLVDIPKLSRSVQSVFAGHASEYPEFKRLYIPALTVMDEGGRARNVILIR